MAVPEAAMRRYPGYSNRGLGLIRVSGAADGDKGGFSADVDRNMHKNRILGLR